MVPCWQNTMLMGMGTRLPGRWREGPAADPGSGMSGVESYQFNS